MYVLGESFIVQCMILSAVMLVGGGANSIVVAAPPPHPLTVDLALTAIEGGMVGRENATPRTVPPPLKTREGNAARIMKVGGTQWGLLVELHAHKLFFSPEKGMCILGESCPYDHGMDPLVIGGNELTPFPAPPLVLPPHGLPLPPNTGKSGEPAVRCSIIAL